MSNRKVIDINSNEDLENAINRILEMVYDLQDRIIELEKISDAFFAFEAMDVNDTGVQ